MSTFGFPPVEPIAGQLDLDGGEIRLLEAQRKPPTGLAEKDWQAQVIELAALYRWRVYHTYDSRRSHEGWPDLILARPPELLAVELKTDTGRLRPAQREWLDVLTACRVETAVWRPREFEAVHARLRMRYDQ